VINVKRKFYITTAIDYVNAPPHLGHLYEKICADVIARFHRLKGEDVFFLTGTDENAQKNEKAAKEAGVDVKEFVDRNAQKFKELCEVFNISNDDFIRTTEERHVKVVQLIFKKLFERGDIYKGFYEGFYCYGCEEFKTEKDLVDGKCPEHDKEPEWLKEETYFFRLSKYQNKILDLLSSGQFVLPPKRRNEVIARVKEGLKDLSVSRTNLNWGIDTPIDRKHKIYVWIDALTNYISALEFPEGEKYKRYWPADIHLIGKGINWFHSVIWPAILLSAEIPLPKSIVVHGYITVGGEKMSKSKGTIVNPLDLAKKYPVDTIRYFLLKEISFYEDGDFTEKSMVEKNNNELVANIGNFIHRTLTFIWSNFNGKVPKPEKYDDLDKNFEERIKAIGVEVGEKLGKLEIDQGLRKILNFSAFCNQYFQKKEPWKTKDTTCLYLSINAVRTLAILLEPYIPSSTEKLWKQLNFNSTEKPSWDSSSELKVKAGHKINKPEILFKKIEDEEIKAQKDKLVEKVRYVEEISFKEFQNLDFRVGKVLEAEEVPNSRNLIRLQVDFGSEKRQSVAGLRQWYKPEELVGKKYVFILNLERKKFMGIESQCMILAADDGKGNIVLVQPEKDIEIGSRVH
jgi:methionyl-tRNA synthetase